jgi:O-antigen/teichoic acid export membrane protein
MKMHTAWNGVSQLAPQLVALAMVPILLHHLGIKGYGVWALVNTLMVFAVSLDGGISNSAQRFYILYLSRGDAKFTARFTTTLLTFVAVATALIYSLGPIISRAVLALTNIPTDLQSDASFLLRNIGLLIGLLLCSNIFMGLLRAVNRFRAIAISTLIAQLGYVTTIVLLADQLTVRRMFTLALVQLGLMNLLLALNCAAHLAQVRLRILSPTEIKELYSYAWRAQITNLSALAIVQTDALFVAAFLPIEQLAYLAIASQVASGIRSLPTFALAPLISQITHRFGRSGFGNATTLASSYSRRWVFLISAYSAITIATIGFGVRGWAGDYPEAEVAAVILALGNACNLMAGVSSAYCRSVGKPGIEARAALVLVIVNLALSGPCTYFGGLTGAVCSTAAAQLVGFVYFHWILRRTVPAFDQGLRQIRLFRLPLMAGCALALGLVSLMLPPRSLATLAVVALAAAIPALLFVLIERRRNT